MIEPMRVYRVWTKDRDGGYTVMTGWMSRSKCKRTILGRWAYWPPFAYISGASNQENFIRYNGK